MLHLNVQIITEEVVALARNMNSFAAKLKADLSLPQVEAIAAMFPGGTTIETASIALCNDAIAAAKSLEAAAPGAIKNVGTHINAIFTKLAVDLTQINHDKPKHTLGYYMKVVGVVLEDIASQL